MKAQILPAVRVTLVLVVLTGILYPLALTGMAQVMFPHQANGSLVMRNGSVVGSELVGQPFSDPGYLHPRPSAAGNGYDATHSGGTNLGPSSSRLLHGVVDKESPDNNFDGVEALAAQVRAENHLPADAPVPVDAVTRSASGLDPHISLAYAALQVPRIAKKRGLAEEEVKRLVDQGTESRSLGVLGEPRVNVLRVNMALDASAPGRTGSRSRAGASTDGACSSSHVQHIGHCRRWAAGCAPPLVTTTGREKTRVMPGEGVCVSCSPSNVRDVSAPQCVKVAP